ncbi:unnamed protein product [Tilletia caries]|uniref:Uncharacterized protein n=1 Tax=Tilletia caries TaxID=13290 RepID=A0A177UNI1_9BASI|nr:hypothetical protein A4X03_0g3035 [Tilletia caries]CAD7060671.1 unnamed protein product [Tilletia caries]
MPPAPRRDHGSTPAVAVAVAVKKEPGASTSTSTSTSTSSHANTAQVAAAAPAPAKKEAPTFRDFPIFSSQLAPNTRINLLRFAHHTPQDPTDPTQFVGPLKMNRKWPPRPKPSPPRPGDPVRDAAGAHLVGLLPPVSENDKPKKGKLYWPPYGQGGLEEIRKALQIPPELNISAFPPAPKKHADHDDDDDDSADSDDASNPSKPSLSKQKGKFPMRGGGGGGGGGGGRGGKRGQSNKKNNIREIHKAPEEIRLLRKQEYMPWVLEDFETSEEWESGVQAANRYKALVAQFGDKYANCAGNAGLVQMYLRGAVDGGQGGGEGVVKEEEEEEKRKKRKVAGFMDRNHAPWIGKLEGDVHSASTATPKPSDPSSSASTTSAYTTVSSSPHVIFVFDHRHDGSFKLVPVQAAYKFTQKPAYSTTTADEANERWEALNKLRQRGGSAYQKMALTAITGGPDAQGQGEGAKALLHARNRNAGIPSRSSGGPGSRSYVKKEKMDEDDDAAELASWSTFQQRSRLVLPGGPASRPRNLLAVFGERGGGGSGGGGGGGGGALDEVEYEEDFADDEEVHQGPGAENAQEEQEQKEYADRLKEEMSRAGWDGRLSDQDGGDSSDDDMDEGETKGGKGGKGKGKAGKGKGKKGGMGRSGKELKKVMKMAGRAEGLDAYDSEDEEVNPYASEDDDTSESDEERHLALTNPEEAVRRAREAKREKEEREAAAAKRRALAAERDGTAAGGDEGGKGVRGSSPATFSGSQGKQPGTPSGSGFASTAQRAAASTAATSTSTATANNPLLRNSGTYIPRRPGSASPPPPSPSTSSRAQTPASPPTPATAAAGVGAGAGLKVTLKRKSEAISGRGVNAAGAGAGNVSPPASRAGSPSAPTSPSAKDTAKRQKTTTTSSSTPRGSSPSASASAAAAKQPANEIEAEVIRLVRDAKVQTTQELVRHFAKAVKDPERKAQLSAAIRRVCMIERGKNTLRLKDGW